jgi:hypothetical protein
MDQQAHDERPGQGLSQIDDNQDELGRDINNPENRIGDRATVDKADAEAAKAERAHELSRKIGLQRERKRDDGDPAQKVSGGFNQKH